MSELVRVNCCRAITVSVHLSRISQSIPPFYADGYTVSESVPESARSISPGPESEVVGSVQKQRGQHQQDVYTISKDRPTENPSGKPGQHPWRNQTVQRHLSPSHGQLGQPECPYLLVAVSAAIESESISEKHNSFGIVSNGLVPGVSTGRAVWMLKMVLLLFLLYLSWLYGNSYSTTTHSLMTCSFSLHHNTISQSMTRSQQRNLTKLLLGRENI
jgi:hypothetical protein